MPVDPNLCPNGAMNNKRALMVIGPHRSGTSVLTRGILCSQWSIGATLIEPNEDNPKGFFENSSMVAFNDALLDYLGLSWDCLGVFEPKLCDQLDTPRWRERAAQVLHEEYSGASNIIVKDPRISLLAPFWDTVLRQEKYQPSYILAIRHPIEAARSQAARRSADPDHHFNGSQLSEAVHLWATYLRSALSFLAHEGGTLVDYSTLLDRPRDTMERLARTLDLPIRIDKLDAYAAEFVTTKLRHHYQEEAPACNDDLVSNYAKIYRSLQIRSKHVAIDTRTAQKHFEEIDVELSRGNVLNRDLNRMYSKAKVAALHASMRNNELQDELLKSQNIIRYNEFLIRTLRTEHEKQGKQDSIS